MENNNKLGGKGRITRGIYSKIYKTPPTKMVF